MPVGPLVLSEPSLDVNGQCGSRGAVKSMLEELVCELLAEAFVKGGCTDKDVFPPHFDHGLCCWRAVGVGTNHLQDFVKDWT